MLRPQFQLDILNFTTTDNNGKAASALLYFDWNIHFFVVLSNMETLYRLRYILVHSYVLFYFKRQLSHCRLHHMNNNSIIQNVSKLMIISASLGVALLVCVSRVYLLYHTIAQVVCGALVGIAFATVWFWLTCAVFTPLYPWVVSWWVPILFFSVLI